jgi:hypothetical protein
MTIRRIEGVSVSCWPSLVRVFSRAKAKGGTVYSRKPAGPSTSQQARPLHPEPAHHQQFMALDIICFSDPSHIPPSKYIHMAQRNIRPC